MNYSQFLSWAQETMTAFAQLGNWLFNPIYKIGSFEVIPIVLFGATGLIAFLAVAIIKWAVS